MACPAVALDREVVRCANPTCRLNQYMTVNELCRRCGEQLKPKVVEPLQVIKMPKPRLHIGTEVRAEFSNTVRFLRLFVGLSQRDLARMMDVPRTYISKLENERNLPTLATLPKLAKAFNITTHQFISIATSRVPDPAALVQ